MYMILEDVIIKLIMQLNIKVNSYLLYHILRLLEYLLDAHYMGQFTLKFMLKLIPFHSSKLIA